MKKFFSFIILPSFILLVAILNAILIYPSFSSYKYFEKSSSQTIRILDNIFYIKENDDLLDFGETINQNSTINFFSNKTSEKIDITTKNVFCLTYNGKTFYCPTTIFLQVVYAIVLVASIATFIFLFCKEVRKKTNTKKLEKDGK